MATEADVKALANNAIDEFLELERKARSKGCPTDNEPFNAADLGCVEARQFVEGDWSLLVEEASPGGCPKLCAFVESYLWQHGVKAEVRTEW